MLVLGITGSGKSSFLNACSGYTGKGPTLFPESSRLAAETLEAEWKDVVWLESNTKVRLCDTRGFGDTDKDTPRHCQKLVKVITGFGTINAVAILVKYNDYRLTASLCNTIEVLKKIFGGDFIQAAILVFTHWMPTMYNDKEEKVNDWQELFSTKFGYAGKIPCFFVDSTFNRERQIGPQKVGLLKSKHRDPVQSQFVQLLGYLVSNTNTIKVGQPCGIDGCNERCEATFRFCGKHRCPEEGCGKSRPCPIHLCRYPHCQLPQSQTSTYCGQHKCTADDKCDQPRSEGLKICAYHTCKHDGCSSVILTDKRCHQHQLRLCAVPKCPVKFVGSKFYCETHACGTPRCDHQAENGIFACKEHRCTLKNNSFQCKRSQNGTSDYCSAHACAGPNCMNPKLQPVGNFCEKHKCAEQGCVNARKDSFTKEYCSRHNCSWNACRDQGYDGSSFCYEHKCYTCKQCRVQGSMYCRSHKCSKCDEGMEEGSLYCSSHKCRYCTSVATYGSFYHYCSSHWCQTCSEGKESTNSHECQKK